MTFKYKYYKVENFLRPIIEVQLSNEDKRVGYLALLDSGADFNVFHSGIASILGIRIDKDDTVKFMGVGKNARVLTGKTGIVTISLFGSGNSYKFDTPVVFSDDIPENGFALLGQRGFFDHFSEVSFRCKDGRIVLRT